MTVSTATSRSGPYAGAGTTGPFTVKFRFLDAAHLEVIRTDATGEHVLVLATDYSVSGVGNPTGSVTLLAALPSGETLTIIRSVPVTQEADYVQNDDFPAESHENVLDKLTMIAQQHDETIGRSLTLPASASSGVSTKLPLPESNKLIGWNEAANGLQNFDTLSLASIVAFGTAKSDVFSGTGAQTTFALTANPGALNNLDVAIGGVTQRPVIDYTWSSGTTLTFTTAPPLGSNNVLARYMQALPQGTSDSAASQFIQAGAGAVPLIAQDKMREAVSVRDFGAKFDGVTDDGPAFNRAILKLSNDGGGVLVAGRGTAKIVTSILHASNVTLDLRGATLSGSGANTIIKSGAVLAGVLTDITTEYGTAAQGAGTNLVYHAPICGGRLMNAACGIRGHRFNYGTIIIGVVFDATLTNSWITSHSWGLKIHQCLVYSPAIMKDFVDWTEVSGNSFEGPGVASGTAAVTVTTGGYGGSYSARFISNGFHHFAKGIEFACEASATVIEGNHFEDVKLQVIGGAQTVQKIRIRNNWMKANLAPAGPGVIPISFQTLVDSELGPNHYSTDGASTFDAYVAISGSNNFGNRIPLSYSPASVLDLSMYQAGDANVIALNGGSNNPALNQPTVETVSGSSGYTVEKYKSRYRAIANTIPYCTVSYVAGTVTIDTWIPSDAFGTRQLVAVNFLIAGANTYQVSGHIARLAFVPVVNVDVFSGGAGVVVTPSNNAGALRITITGASAVGNITGWVKEL